MRLRSLLLNTRRKHLPLNGVSNPPLPFHGV
jgi:hypothetical protein